MLHTQKTPVRKQQRDDSLAMLHRQNRAQNNGYYSSSSSLRQNSSSSMGKDRMEKENQQGQSHSSSIQKSSTQKTQRPTTTTTTTFPQTPYSLLKEEMRISSNEKDNNASMMDESLLLSPTPSSTTTATNQSKTTNTTNIIHTSKSTRVKPTKLSSPPIRLLQQPTKKPSVTIKTVVENPIPLSNTNTKTSTPTTSTTIQVSALTHHDRSNTEWKQSGTASETDEKGFIHVQTSIPTQAVTSSQSIVRVPTHPPIPRQRMMDSTWMPMRIPAPMKHPTILSSPPVSNNSAKIAASATTPAETKANDSSSTKTPQLQVPTKSPRTTTIHQHGSNHHHTHQPSSSGHWSKTSTCSSSWNNNPSKFSVMYQTTISTNNTNDTPSCSMKANGICMDLSGIFSNVTKSNHNIPSSHSLQHSPVQGKDQFDLTTTTTTTKNITTRPLHNKKEEKAEEEQVNDWSEKQVETLTKWLNYLFHPTENENNDSGNQNDVAKDNNTNNNNNNNNTTSTRGALCELIRHQRMAQHRWLAQEVWVQNEPIRNIVVQEISKNKVALRTDQDMYANLNQRHKVLSLLLSYSTSWLRLGLETMFRTTLSFPETTTTTTQGHPPTESQLRFALKHFIVHRVLSDAHILDKYTHGKCMIPSGPFEAKYRSELRSLVVYRLLVLILFLDRAKMANCLPNVPMLFHIHAKVKSTRDVLLSFCRDFLKSEGDFVKHLFRVGIPVYYQQEKVNELDFVVTNLRVDLNDGVRLARMTELLTGVSLLTKLRLPSVSRLQKIYNVRLALDNLVSVGVNLDTVKPHHIVDGHREMVLKLLWSVITCCCLHDLISLEQIHTEIARIQALSCRSMHPALVATITHAAEGGPSNHDQDTSLQTALLQWSNTICVQFMKSKVNNLTTAFSDGKVVCYLIHYYHPTLLHRNEILATRRDATANRLYNLDTLLSNERSNAMVANRCMSEMGGIPAIVPICDSTNNIPEEKSMLFCLAYLFSRLTESHVEVRACVRIQNCYRMYHNRKVHQRQCHAAKLILTIWRQQRMNYFITQQQRYGYAVRVIETFVRNYSSGLQRRRAYRLERQQSIVTTILIQKIWRSYRAKKYVNEKRRINQAILVLQKTWRAATARTLYRFLIHRQTAALTIQYYWSCSRLRDLQKEKAAIRIQRIFRGYWSRIQYTIDLLDIICIQRYSKKVLAKRYRKSLLRAAQTIQCAVRCYRVRQHHRQKKSRLYASIRIETIVRMYFAKKVAALKHRQADAAIVLQAHCRRLHAKRFFLALKYSNEQQCAVILIQSMWRRTLSINLLQKLQHIESERHAIIKIQSLVRKMQAKCQLARRLYFHAQEGAAVLVQTTFRKYLAKILFEIAKIRARRQVAAVRIQAIWRRHRMQCNFASFKYFACIVQAYCRMFLQQRHFRTARHSATVIQATMRKSLCVQRYGNILRVLPLMQSAVRMFLAVLENIRRKVAVCDIQCASRQWLARRKKAQYQKDKVLRWTAAVTAQKYWRGFHICSKYHLVRRDAILIQTAFRRVMARRKRAARQKLIICLQKIARSWISRKILVTLRNQMIAQKLVQLSSTTLIQSSYRGWIIRRELRYLNLCADTIQRVFRGHVARIDCQLKILDIILTQSIVRKWIANQQVGRRKQAVLQLQCWVRINLAKVKRMHLLQKCGAATMIQKTWRCYTIHVEYMLYILATIDIQACTRRFIAVTAYTRQYSTILRLQAYIRMAVSKLRAQREKRCISQIQSMVRAFLQRAAFSRQLKEEQAAMKIQSIHRMFVCKRNLLVEVLASRIVQRYIRGFVVRLQLQSDNFAASEIQRIWKGFVACRYLAWSIVSATTIQSVWRMVLGKNRLRDLRLENIAVERIRQKNVIVLQKTFRMYISKKKMYLAATIIQNATCVFLSRIAFGKLRKSVIRTQAIVRGRHTRTKCVNKVRQSAARIQKENLRARANPKMLLGYRAKVALETLLKSKSLSEIMEAVTTLEIATRLAETCCHSFVSAGAIQILFSLIRTCNRSLPHIKLLHGVLMTMSNIAKYDYLLSSMATCAGVEVFLDLVQMFRDKDAIFCLVVSLLDLVVASSDEVLIFCSSKENMKRLKGVCGLCIHKLSVSDRTSLLSRRSSLETSLSKSAHCKGAGSYMRYHETPNLRTGVRMLQRVIQSIDSRRQG